MSTYRCLRLLALDLSKAGFHVLRFDYSCVGNSWGSFEQASASRWVRDIDAAVRELSGRLNTSSISLVGLRLGAALAYRATRQAHVRQLVLWDPVADGREYMTRLRALQARTHKQDCDPAGNAGEELLGYDYSPALVRELECLDLTVETPGCDRVSVVLTEETPGANRLRESLAQRATRPAVQLVATRTGWDDETYDRSLTLHEARRAVADLLERVLS
jgi:pimeloyl-ACP methyl ester carboxylesterase